MTVEQLAEEIRDRVLYALKRRHPSELQMELKCDDRGHSITIVAGSRTYVTMSKTPVTAKVQSGA